MSCSTCRCGHEWSQHIGTYGDGYVLCHGGKCKCAYKQVRVAIRREYGGGIRKDALKARRKHEQSEKFYLEMAVDRELMRRAEKDSK